MNCKKFRETINEYLDNALQKDKIPSVEEHIKGCPECKEYVEKYRKFASLLKKAEEKKAPDYLWTRIDAELEERGRKKGFLHIKEKVLLSHSWVWGLASIFLVSAIIYFYTGRVKQARYNMVNNYVNECIDCFAGEPFTDEESYEAFEENGEFVFFLEDMFTANNLNDSESLEYYNSYNSL